MSGSPPWAPLWPGTSTRASWASTCPRLEPLEGWRATLGRAFEKGVLLVQHRTPGMPSAAGSMCWGLLAGATGPQTTALKCIAGTQASHLHLRIPQHSIGISPPPACYQASSVSVSKTIIPASSMSPLLPAGWPYPCDVVPAHALGGVCQLGGLQGHILHNSRRRRRHLRQPL